MRSRTDSAARTLAAFTEYTTTEPLEDTGRTPAEVLTEGLPDTDDLPSQWAGVVALEGMPTGDGRMFEPNALTWDLGTEGRGLPLRAVIADVGAHDGAEVVGTIRTLERRDGGKIWATGDFDLSTEAGRAAAALVVSKRKTGVSVDLDSVSFEVRVKSEMIEPMLEEPTDEAATPSADPDGRVTVATIGSDDELLVTTSARVRAVTLVDIPAFAEAHIDAEGTEQPTERDAVTASAAPIDPPAAWLADPKLPGPTPLVITDEGRVYGHLAAWDTCHTAQPAGPGTCLVPPHSATGYARFHTGTIRTAEGATVDVGRLTLGTGHADQRLGATAAAEHYDNTGAAVADVRAGEDAYGIWVAGALRPGVTPEQVRILRASPLSGDWRRVNGNLELHAALAVNMPGFPIPRTAGLVASGELDTLIAAGAVSHDRPTPPAATTIADRLSPADLDRLGRLLEGEKQRELAAIKRVAEQRRAAKLERFAAARARM